MLGVHGRQVKRDMSKPKKHCHCYNPSREASSTFHNYKITIIGIYSFTTHSFYNSIHNSWFNPCFMIWISFSDLNPILWSDHHFLIRVNSREGSLKYLKIWIMEYFKFLVTETDFGGGQYKNTKWRKFLWS